MPYKALHAMSAATDSGEIIKYEVGDVIPDVESWPTFEQLKNIEWIAAVSDDDEQVENSEVHSTAPGAIPQPRHRRR